MTIINLLFSIIIICLIIFILFNGCHISFTENFEEINSTNTKDKSKVGYPKTSVIEDDERPEITKALTNFPNKVFAKEFQGKGMTELLSDENFKNKYPMIYESLINIVFRNYLPSSMNRNISYTLTIRNDQCPSCDSDTNIKNALNTLDDSQIEEIKNVLNDNINLSPMDPAYSILGQFDGMSTCLQQCTEEEDRPDEPVAFNCFFK